MIGMLSRMYRPRQEISTGALSSPHDLHISNILRVNSYLTDTGAYERWPDVMEHNMLPPETEPLKPGHDIPIEILIRLEDKLDVRGTYAPTIPGSFLVQDGYTDA